MSLNIAPNDHQAYMRHALSLAELSPPKPTNYRVGALLVDTDKNTILATGYTLELPGNTHAEQSCFLKLQTLHNIPQNEDQLHLLTAQKILPENTVLYTTVEPCSMRLSGNIPCVDRILKIGKEGIKRVYVGVREPEKFVGENIGRKRLEDAGIEVVLVGGLEEEILKVATAGHTE